MTLAEAVGAELARVRNGRSRRSMAKEIGVSDTALLRLEHGTANPTLARLEAVASAYGVELIVKAKPRHG